MPATIEEKYGLKQSNFILDPVADADFYAERMKIDLAKLIESLRVDLVTQLAPKRLYYGPYGGGTIREENQRELPIGKSEKFLRLQNHLQHHFWCSRKRLYLLEEIGRGDWI